MRARYGRGAGFAASEGRDDLSYRTREPVHHGGRARHENGRTYPRYTASLSDVSRSAAGREESRYSRHREYRTEDRKKAQISLARFLNMYRKMWKTYFRGLVRAMLIC